MPSISDDGSRVVFTSEATNLDPGDTDPERDVYIRDRDTDHDGIFDEPGAVSTTLLSGDVPGGQLEPIRPRSTATGTARCTK